MQTFRCTQQISCEKIFWLIFSVCVFFSFVVLKSNEQYCQWIFIVRNISHIQIHLQWHNTKWMSDVCLLFFNLAHSHLCNMCTMELGWKEMKSTHTTMNECVKIKLNAFAFVQMSNSFILPIVPKNISCFPVLSQVVVSLLLPHQFSELRLFCYFIQSKHVSCTLVSFKLWRLMHRMLVIESLQLLIFVEIQINTLSNPAVAFPEWFLIRIINIFIWFFICFCVSNHIYCNAKLRMKISSLCEKWWIHSSLTNCFCWQSLCVLHLHICELSCTRKISHM